MKATEALKLVTATTVTVHERYTSDVNEDTVRITGVQVSDNDTVYLAGENGYVLNIEGNKLIQHDFDTKCIEFTSHCEWSVSQKRCND